MSKAKIALVTSGGIVPFGNPDHIAASSAQNFGEYDITGVTDLLQGKYQTAHGATTRPTPIRTRTRAARGRAARPGKGRPHRLPASALLFHRGNGTAVAKAKAFGIEIGKRLKDAQVQAVILTST